MEKKQENKLTLRKISINKQAKYDFFIEEKFEAGLILQGWEVQSIRSGKANISNSYIFFKNGEAFLFGANFAPAITSSSLNFVCNPTRDRKLLLNQRELNFLYGRKERKGYTIIPLSLYWKHAWCKIEIGIAKGKTKRDKRNDLKKREWTAEQARLIKIKTSNTAF